MLPKTYLEPCQISKMKLFAKIIKDYKPLTISAKHSTLYFWQSSKSQYHIQMINFLNQAKFHFRIETSLISMALLITSLQVFRLQSFLSLYLHVYHIKQIVLSLQASSFRIAYYQWFCCKVCTSGKSGFPINRSTMDSIQTVSVIQGTKI